MEYWEFLLQKEGDHTWLPLESAKVEILEGRYRVMAHSSRINAPVEVRISHLLLDRMPPKRRVLKRMGQINAHGLMVVLPFTQLQPGTWEVQCTNPDVMDTLLGETWQHAIQLRVVSHEDEVGESWDEDESWSDQDTYPRFGDTESAPPLSTVGMTAMPEGAEPIIASADAAVDDDFQRELEALSQQVLDTVFEDLDVTQGLSRSESRPPLPEARSSDLRALPIAALAPHGGASGVVLDGSVPEIKVVLGQQAYMAQAGQSLLITGSVESAIPQQDAVGLESARIHLCLLDPQTSDLLAEQVLEISPQPLPAEFSVSIQVPTQADTHLFVGEVALYDWAQPPRCLAIQQFTVTVGLADLLTAIANQAENQDLFALDFATHGTEGESEPEPEPEPDQPLPPKVIDLPLSQSPPSPPLNLPQVPLQLPNPAPRTPQSTVYLPSFGLNLPPQIARPEDVSNIQSPKLPGFVARPTIPQPPPEDALAAPSIDETVSPDAISARAEDWLAAEADQTDPVEPSSLSSEPSPSPVPAPPWMEDQAVEATLPAPEPLQPPHVDPPEATSTTDAAFKALNLRERFWSRLNSLAVEAHQAAAELKAAIAEAGVSIEPEPSAPTLPTPEPPPAVEPERPPSWLGQEVVVYDEPEPDIGIPPAAASTGEAEYQPIPDEDAPPVPIPTIELPHSELIAGEVITIGVSVPSHSQRLYAKLWVSDLQTRMLADEPRWLMELVPNEDGRLETTLQLQVPHGCLEARFEAIAIEMVSQRESYKAIVDRTILPSNLPSNSLDEFEL